MLATTINYLDRQTLAVAADAICKDLGLSNAQYGDIAAVFLLAYGLTHPFVGRFIDCVGTRAGMAIAVTFWSIANIAHAFATGFGSLRFMRLLLGIGEAGNFPAAIKSISEWFPPRERTVATGIMNIGAGAGAVIAPPLVACLVSMHGWQTAFVVTGASGFVWLILWLLLYRHPLAHPRLTPEEREHILSQQALEVAPPESDTRSVWVEALSRRELWFLMASRFISDPAWFFYLIWLPKYLMDERHFNLKEVGMFAWVPYLGADFGSIIGGLLSAWLMKRGFSLMNARKIAMCIFALMMPVAIPAVLSHSAAMALFFITIATTAHQAYMASMLTLPADLFPKRSVASAFGLIAMMGMLGASFFQHQVGQLIGSVGYVPVFTTVGCLHPIAALIVVLFVRSKVRNRQTLALG